MRLGPLTIRLIALVAVGLATRVLVAQSGGGSNYQPPQFYALQRAPERPMQAMYMAPMGVGPASPYVDVYGNPAVVPAGYCADCGGDCCGSDCYGGDCDGGDCYDGDCYGCDCGCAACGGCYGPCPDCSMGGGYGGPAAHGGFCRYGYGGSWQDCRTGTYPPFPDDVEDYSLLPPGRTEQCGPHYFDVRMEAVWMTRDETFRAPIDFTSLNVDGPIVLSSTQLDFETETGFRILGRYDVGPLSVIEFGYWGLENLDARASFTDPDPVDPNTGNLYSLFTDFVRNPALLPPDVTTPGGSLPWTERSVTHSISLESELHTGEFNYRRYWVGFNPMVSGTLLAGFRFTRLREDFLFAASGEARGEYLESIKNDMAGFQTGGDVWLHIRQGVRIGAEGKVGLMNNHYTLDNTFSTNPVAGTPPDFTEHFEKDIPALIVDASADVVWDVCPSWSVRAGYEILFLNSVLLAGENFNTGTVYNGVPGVFLPQRVPFVNDQGDAFYHGAHLGAEFIW
jgi:hypothetical protein